MQLIKIPRIIAVCVFVMCASACGTRSPGTLPMPDEAGPVRYEPPQPVEWKLANGLTVLLIQDDELPLVRGTLYMPGGSLLEFSDKPALIGVMGQQMRQGGAGRYSADQLDLELEKLSAAIGSSYGAEFGSVSFSGLSADFEKVFGIFTDVVRSPRFEQDRLDLWKGQSVEAIRRRSDDPSTVASIGFKTMVFGDNVFGRVFSENNVKEIVRLDMLRAHRYFVRPDSAFLAVTGNIDRATLEEAVERRFGSWSPRGAALPDFPKFSFRAEPAIYFIRQPLAQSTVYMGQAGPPRLTPDAPAIEGFNSILGAGDFGSRLVRIIRTEMGLAYNVYGSILPSFEVGQNIVVIQTKSESTPRAIAESIKIIEEMRENDVQEDELEQARQTIRNSFVFKFDTPDDVVTRAVLLRLLSYPPDYDKTYLDRVSALTPPDIRETARRWWNPGGLVIVIVGDQAAYDAVREGIEKAPGDFRNLQIKTCGFTDRITLCN